MMPQALGAAFDVSHLHIQGKHHLEFNVHGVPNRTPLYGSHFLYDGDEKFYFIGDAVTFRAAERWCGLGLDNLYPVEDLPAIWLEQGQFLGHLQYIQVPPGQTEMTPDSFFHLGTNHSDAVDMTFVSRMNNDIIRRAIPEPVWDPLYPSDFVATETYALFDETLDEPMTLTGNYIVRHENRLFLVRDAEQLEDVYDATGSGYDDTYRIHHLAEMLGAAPGGTIFQAKTGDVWENIFVVRNVAATIIPMS